MSLKWGVFTLVVALLAVLMLTHKYKIEAFTNLKNCSEAGVLAEMLNKNDVDLNTVENTLNASVTACSVKMTAAGLNSASPVDQINAIPECKTQNELAARQQQLLNERTTSQGRFLTTRDLCRKERKEKPAKVRLTAGDMNACAEVPGYEAKLVEDTTAMKNAPPSMKNQLQRQLNETKTILNRLKNQCTQITEDRNEMAAYRKKEVDALEVIRRAEEEKLRQQREASERLARESSLRDEARRCNEELQRQKGLLDSARASQAETDARVREATARADKERTDRERAEREWIDKERLAREEASRTAREIVLREEQARCAREKAEAESALRQSALTAQLAAEKAAADKAARDAAAAANLKCEQERIATAATARVAAERKAADDNYVREGENQGNSVQLAFWGNQKAFCPSQRNALKAELDRFTAPFNNQPNVEINRRNYFVAKGKYDRVVLRCL